VEVKRKYDLRDYQKEAIQDCMDYIDCSANIPVLAVLPTAAGKSLIIGEVAKEISRREKGICVVLQPSIELLKQNVDKAKNLGCEDIKVYSASLDSKEISDTLTYGTLGSIKKDIDKLIKLGVDTLLVDEAHFKFSEKKSGEFMKFFNKLKPKKTIGFTATPFKLFPGRGGSRLVMLNRIKGKIFKGIIHVTQIKQLVDNNYWSPINYETHDFDDSGLRFNSTGNTFTDESVRMVMDEQGINNNIYLRVMDLLKKGYTKILVFTDCLYTAERLSEYVPDSIALSSESTDKQRKKGVEDFLVGDKKVLFNYGLFTTGFDYPELEVVIMGRPTNSLSLYYQIVGRGVRIHENKEEVLFIDFCGNVRRFGKIEDLELLDYNNYGWGVFSGDDLLTGIHLGLYSINKHYIDNPDKSFNDMTLWFGKHKGKKVKYLIHKDPGYLKWIITNDNMDLGTEKGMALKNCIIQNMANKAVFG
jgi:DNA repair protein RadD